MRRSRLIFLSDRLAVAQYANDRKPLTRPHFASMPVDPDDDLTFASVAAANGSQESCTHRTCPNKTKDTTSALMLREVSVTKPATFRENHPNWLSAQSHSSCNVYQQRGLEMRLPTIIADLRSGPRRPSRVWVITVSARQPL